MVNDEQVVLEKNEGTRKNKSNEGGEYWRIYAEGKLAGKIFMDLVNKRPTIQIFLNKNSQGKGIGRIAYRKACEESQYPIIYADMRKSNIASRKAAEYAGFKVDVTPGQKQLTMVWKRISIKL